MFMGVIIQMFINTAFCVFFAASSIYNIYTVHSLTQTHTLARGHFFLAAL